MPDRLQTVSFKTNNFKIMLLNIVILFIHIYIINTEDKQSYLLRRNALKYVDDEQQTGHKIHLSEMEKKVCNVFCLFVT